MIDGSSSISIFKLLAQIVEVWEGLKGCVGRSLECRESLRPEGGKSSVNIVQKSLTTLLCFQTNLKIIYVTMYGKLSELHSILWQEKVQKSKKTIETNFTTLYKLSLIILEHPFNEFSSDNFPFTVI